MTVDIEMIRVHQRELNMASDEIASARRKLRGYQCMLDDAWKSAEIRGMDVVIEDITRRLNRISGELEDLGHEVVVAGEEMEAEEAAASGLTVQAES